MAKRANGLWVFCARCQRRFRDDIRFDLYDDYTPNTDKRDKKRAGGLHILREVGSDGRSIVSERVVCPEHGELVTPDLEALRDQLRANPDQVITQYLSPA